jgi:hypothetical protein
LTFRIAALVMFGILSPAALASHADDVVLQDRPVAYWTMGSRYRVVWEHDASRNGHRAMRVPRGGFPFTEMPNRDKATVLDGRTQYLEVNSHANFSIPTTGELTITAWIRPDVLQFPQQEGSGYVHWLGKGQPGQHEYVARMYSRTNAESRPNRISGYAFNLDGQLGSGSYFQDPVAVGEWIHVAIVFNTNDTSTQYPDGYVRIYKNGVLRDTTGLDQFRVLPRAGTAPFRIGTRDKSSYFKGAIGKVAIFNHELTPARLAAHVRAMYP